MDADQHVLDGLRMDTGIYIDHLRKTPLNALASLSVSQAAEILIPTHEVPDSRQMLAEAFTGGGLVTYEAFYHADLPTETVRKVTNSFKYDLSYAHVDSGKPDVTFKIYDNLATQGLKDHPELLEHVNKVSQYYCEVTQDKKYGIYALLGLGYTASQLDILIQEYTRQQLDDVFGVGPNGIDWDLSLRKFNTEK